MNYRKVIPWTIVILLFFVGFFYLGSQFGGRPEPQGPPAYSISQGPGGMIGGSAYYTLDYGTSSGVNLPLEQLIAPVQRYLGQIDESNLQVGRLREFRLAYLVEVIDKETGNNAFGLMLGKNTLQISPKAGPNIFWNTKYGDQIAEIGGGYGMLGRLLPKDPVTETTISEQEARTIAEDSIDSVNEDLSLDNTSTTYYGFYEFYTVRDGDLIGEIDVNAYSGQVWFKEWGEPQIAVINME